MTRARADFFLSRGGDAEWLGSIAWGGYPDSAAIHTIAGASSPEDYASRVAALLNATEGSTSPTRGHDAPWPGVGHASSRAAYYTGRGTGKTIDYVYVWEGGKCYCTYKRRVEVPFARG